jgi:hypothetical protein
MKKSIIAALLAACIILPMGAETAFESVNAAIQARMALANESGIGAGVSRADVARLDKGTSFTFTRIVGKLEYAMAFEAESTVGKVLVEAKNAAGQTLYSQEVDLAKQKTVIFRGTGIMTLAFSVTLKECSESGAVVGCFIHSLD